MKRGKINHYNYKPKQIALKRSGILNIDHEILQRKLNSVDGRVGQWHEKKLAWTDERTGRAGPSKVVQREKIRNDAEGHILGTKHFKSHFTRFGKVTKERLF